MPFQPKENMIIAPICRRIDIINMGNEERDEFIEALDKLILKDTKV